MNGNPATMTVLGDDAVVRPGFDAGVLEVVAARAHEASLRPPLFTDPYAQSLVDAAGAAVDIPSAAAINHVAARTKWFDDFFLTASSAGVSQIVILAAGLDTRAWRLPWLDDTVIYEIDRPEVLEFKSRVLAESGATPSAKYVPVAHDLHDDWPKALTAAGLDYTEPTAWAAEGLLRTLPPHARDQLFDRIELYSGRGSRIAVEAHATDPTDVACWLCAKGWEVTSTSAADLMSRYHRAPDLGDDGTVFLDARKL